MATNGNVSVVVTKWNSLRFSWETTAQSIADNTSTVSWKLELITSGYGRIDSTRDKDYSIVVNGITYSGVNKIGIGNNETKTLASGSTVIGHNADGSKNFSFSFTQEFNITFSGEKLGYISGSGTGTLDSIPRHATLTAAPNFSDEENPTITYSNPAGDAVSSLMVCISLDGNNDDIKFRDISKAGNTYTFTLTDAERNLLRNATTTANNRTVVFSLATNINGVWSYSKLYKTLTIVKAAPTIAPTVKDVFSDTIQLTGNSNTFVKYYSNAEYTFNATAYKGASITAYKVVCGGKENTAANGTINAVESGSFVFTATDSRGNTVSQTINRTLINYIKPTCNIDVKAPTTDGETTINVSGNCFNGSFGTNSNELIIQYRYKENGGSYGSWITAAATVNNENKYSAAVDLTRLNYRNTYTFQAIAKDKIEVIYSAEITVRTQPVFDWGANDFNFNVPVSFNSAVMNDFIVDQGIESDWFYRKWNSGIAECWRLYYDTTNASATYYNGFYYSPTITVPFPFTFTNLPCVQANGGSAANMNFVRVFGQYEDGASFCVCGLTDSATNTDITVNLYAIGKWK